MTAPKTAGTPPTCTGESVGRESFPAARPALTFTRWASLVLALTCVTVTVITMRANGVLVLAMLFATVHAWTVGAFRKEFWS